MLWVRAIKRSSADWVAGLRAATASPCRRLIIEKPVSDCTRWVYSRCAAASSWSTVPSACACASGPPAAWRSAVGACAPAASAPGSYRVTIAPLDYKICVSEGAHQ